MLYLGIILGAALGVLGMVLIAIFHLFFSEVSENRRLQLAERRSRQRDLLRRALKIRDERAYLFGADLRCTCDECGASRIMFIKTFKLFTDAVQTELSRGEK